MNSPNIFPGTLRPRLFIASASSNIKFVEALRDSLSTILETDAWTDGMFFAGKVTLDVLHSIVRKNEFAVCVFGGPGTTNHNVLIELGMFLSVNGVGRTFIVLWGDSHNVPSDLAGVTYIRIPSKYKNSHEAAAFGFRLIRDAISQLWRESGIYGVGKSWHDSFIHVNANAVVRELCEEGNRVHYDLPEAIVIKSGGFITFRSSFEMFNFVVPAKGFFFGRGTLHNNIAYMHYVGTIPDLNAEFHGTMVAYIPDMAPIWGLFLSRDELLQIGLNICLGAFRIDRRKSSIA